jgi:arylsulfatase A-like enzyme
MASTDAPAGRDAIAASSALRPALAVAALLVAGKAFLVGRPEDGLRAWCAHLVALTWQDALFAAAFALAGALLLGLTRRRPAAQRMAWRAIVLAGVVAVVYTVFHVGFYETFRRAVNLPMLRFAGDMKNLESSITARLTWPYVVALTALPVGFALGFGRPRFSRRGPVAAVALLVAWVGLGHRWQRAYGLEWMDRMGQNPQAVLLHSIALDWRGAAGATLPRDFAAADLEEFRTVAERARRNPPPTATARVHNVIVLVLESTGTRYLGLYGSRHDTTPHLVAEARNALVFDNFYANVGHTVCSFMVLNFSIYPGLPWCYVPCGNRPLPDTLPAMLRARGYRTGLLSSADMNYEGMAWAAERNGYEAVKSYWDLGCSNLSSWGSSDRCLFDGVLKYVDEKPGAPFYVMAWTNQTHDPYVMSPDAPVADFLGPGTAKSDLGRYLNILHTVDEGIARLLDGLRARGLDQDTLVVITGDHGEAFADPHDYRGHGGILYDENVHVPLVLWNPRLFAGAGRSTRVGAHVDLNPTIAELLGVPFPGGWQGTSLFDDARPERAYFLTGLGEYQFGVREGPYKYVYSATFGKDHMYDITRDPEELVDVAASEPALCARQRRRIGAWIAYEDYLLKKTPIDLTPARTAD